MKCSQTNGEREKKNSGKNRNRKTGWKENCEYSAFKWLINGYEVK